MRSSVLQKLIEKQKIDKFGTLISENKWNEILELIFKNNMKIEDVILTSSKTKNLHLFFQYLTTLEPNNFIISIISRILPEIYLDHKNFINENFINYLSNFRNFNNLIVEIIIRLFITTNDIFFSELCINFLNLSFFQYNIISNLIIKFFPQTSFPLEQQMNYLNSTLLICLKNKDITLNVINRIFQHLVALDCELLISSTTENNLFIIDDDIALLLSPQLSVFLNFCENLDKDIFTVLLQLFELYLIDLPRVTTTQFIFFFICSLESSLCEQFIGFLLYKLLDTSNNNFRSKKNSALYISSLVARAKFISDNFAYTVVYYIENFAFIYNNHIHKETPEFLSRNINKHWIFYYCIQCITYICCWRWNSWEKSNINPFKRWRLKELISDELLALTVIDKNTAEQFSTIIDFNIDNNNEVLIDKIEVWFPFDPCPLEDFSLKFQNNYRSWDELPDTNDIDEILDFGLNKICKNRGIQFDTFQDNFLLK